MSDVAAGLSTQEAEERLKLYGFNEVPEKKESLLRRFLKKFWGVTPWMLEAAIALTIVLGKYFDTAMITFLLVFNSILGFSQEERANAALDFLKERLSLEARIKRDGRWSTLPARLLVKGDVIRLRAGDIVPADVKIIEGTVDMDQSVLTGESFIVSKSAGDILFSSTIVRRGEATCEVVATGAGTYFGKTVSLVQIARPKLRMESVTAKVVWWLMIMIASLMTVGFAVELLKGRDLLGLLPLALILLISAIPIALPTIFVISAALGSRELATKGALTTRLNALESAAGMDILCVDKTGTITMNKLYVADAMPVPPYTRKDVILFGALSSEEANRDPIDMAFITAMHDNDIGPEGYVKRSFIPFDPSTRLTRATVEKDGKSLIAIKGAVDTVIELCEAGAVTLERAKRDAKSSLREKGYRAIAVAVGEPGGPLRLAGIAFLMDRPRPDSAALIHKLAELGINTKMLTGDGLPVARETAIQVGLGPDVRKFSEIKGEIEGNRALKAIELCDGFAEIFPEDKFFIVESLQKGGHAVGMTGDGINDTPALRQADVGIAVSSAADAAKKAAGIVLTTEGLVGIVDLVIVGRMIYRRIDTWIFNKIVKTFQVIVFVILALVLTGQFVISVFGIVLYLFLSDFVTLSLSTDNVSYSKKPERWDILKLVKVSVPLGMVIVVESFALLYFGTGYFGLQSVDSTNTYVFVMLMFFSLLDVFIVRESGRFWRSKPGTALLLSIGMDMVLVIAVSILGLPGLAPIGIGAVLFLLASSVLLTFAVNDLIKVALIKSLWKAE